MKYNGKIVDLPEPEVLVIPRKGGDLVFYAAPVINTEDFEKLCPRPIAPTITYKGGTTKEDIEDKNYKAALNDWAQKRADWLLIESLKATKDLAWETVKAGEPDTWANAREELKQCLTEPESVRVIDLVFTACGLNQEKIDEATKSFLAGQAETP